MQRNLLAVILMFTQLKEIVTLSLINYYRLNVMAKPKFVPCLN
jgi:hypothetical protein